MQNALLNTDLENNYTEALREMGYNLEKLYTQVREAGAGRGRAGGGRPGGRSPTLRSGMAASGGSRRASWTPWRR